MALPPRHPVDHTPEYVLSFDNAWDMDLLDYEFAVIADRSKAVPDRPVPWAKVDEHPWLQYRLGHTRADLGQVLHYLRADADPVRFVLRRMTLRQWTTVQDRGGTHPADARNIAVRCCVANVDGHEFKFKRGGTEDGTLDDSDLDLLRSLVGDEGLVELGTVCVETSRELLNREKKH